MWEPRRLTTLWASTACYRDSVAFLTSYSYTLGQVFSEYFGFPCQLSFHLLFQAHHHLSSGTGTVGQVVAHVPSGLSLTRPQKLKKKVKNAINYLVQMVNLGPVYKVRQDVEGSGSLTVSGTAQQQICLGLLGKAAYPIKYSCPLTEPRISRTHNRL
jgi:hypothetical protein